jgi:sn-glycerol 3-phosphate transport system permease protein
VHPAFDEPHLQERYHQQHHEQHRRDGRRISVVSKWNDYIWPLLVTNTADMRTLPVGLTALQDSEGSTEWGIVMAGAVFVVLPVLGLFLWAQRHIVEGLTAGSVKG